MVKLISSCLLFLTFHSHAQQVSTFSGIPYTGSGAFNNKITLPNDSVFYSHPYGITVDSSGMLYISNEHQIIRIHQNNSTLVAGYLGNPAMAEAADSRDSTGIHARFSSPAGLATNSITNEIIVADLANSQVRKVSPYINEFTEQNTTTLAGEKLLNGGYKDGIAALSRFNHPAGVAVHANGDVYVSDRDNHCIRRISAGYVTTVAGKSGFSGNVNDTGSLARFNKPAGLEIDGDYLFIADKGNQSIRKMHMNTGMVSTVISTGLIAPSDLVKWQSNWYITDDICVRLYNGTTTSVYCGNPGQEGHLDDAGPAARFRILTSICFNPSDQSFYVVDNGNNVIRKISPVQAPIVDFTASSQNVSVNQNLILKAVISNSYNKLKWTISPSTYIINNGMNDQDPVVYLEFTQAGTYSVKLWAENSSGNDSLTRISYITVSVANGKPEVDFEASNRKPATNEVITLIDLSTDNCNSWKWRIAPPTCIWVDGTDSNSRFPRLKFTNADDYHVTLFSSNTFGSDTLQKLNYINVMTSGFRGQDRDENNIVVYPVPCTEYLFVKSPFGINDYQIFTSTGQCILKTDRAPIFTYQLPDGLYYLVLHSGSRYFQKTFTIQH